MTSQTLDATGLRCPLPVLRTRRLLDELSPGDSLTLVADDPTSVTDVPAFCRMTGHELKMVEDLGGRYVFEIVKHAIDDDDEAEDHQPPEQRIAIRS